MSDKDINHQTAIRQLISLNERLVTSDYIVDETLTLFRARSQNQCAITFGRKVIDQSYAQIIKISEQDLANAWRIFQKFDDKEWSFTDCTSQVVMVRLRIQKAFAFDEHFRQFGTVTVVPESN